MATVSARPAARTYVPVTRDSEKLRLELAERGLADRELLRTTTRLVHDLRLAGSSAERPERRADLALHLRYWSAVRSVLVPDETISTIEAYDPDIRDLDPDRMLELATSGAGASQYEITRFTVRRERAERFYVDGCRLVDGRIEELVVDHLSLQETGIFSTHLRAIDAGLFNAQFSGLISSSVEGRMRSADFTESAMRDVDLRLHVAGVAVFDGAELGDHDNSILADNLQGLPHWPRDRAGVRFTECAFDGATTLVGTRLDGARFTRCAFAELDVTAAVLSRTVFAGCTLAGRPLRLDDLEAATPTTVGEPTVTNDRPPAAPTP